MTARATVILKNGQTVHLLKSDRVEVLAWLIRHDSDIAHFTVETVSTEDFRQGRMP